MKLKCERVARFGVVGGTGFLVDAGVLMVLLSMGWANPYIARCFSFPPAVLVTWLLNRCFVFESHADSLRAKGREYGRYFAVQFLGVLINFAVYSVCIFLFSFFRDWPILALAAGSGVAMVFNFIGAGYWVFRKP